MTTKSMSSSSSSRLSPRRLARRLVASLPPPRNKAAARTVGALHDTVGAMRDLIVGKESAPRPAPEPPASQPEPEPPMARSPLPKPEPIPEDVPWLIPNDVTGSATVVKLLYGPEPPPITFDVQLLEQLNKEYADKRIVPNPPTYDAAALEKAARRRISAVHSLVDLRDKRTLEVGCGNGFEVWSLAHNLGSDAHGVDVVHYTPWDQLAGDRVHFECADLSADNPYPHNYFDRILSFTVWEHVLHPYAMLKATYDVLKPGGIAWIRANLFAGPQASHRYRDIYFPWPHLLFSDDVVRDWDAKHGRKPRGNVWVNRLSWPHYDYYVREIGFEVLHRTFTEAPIDEEFYQRFHDMLSRYPRADLRRDYVTLVLRKPE